MSLTFFSSLRLEGLDNCIFPIVAGPFLLAGLRAYSCSLISGSNFKWGLLLDGFELGIFSRGGSRALCGGINKTFVR